MVDKPRGHSRFNKVASGGRTDVVTVRLTPQASQWVEAQRGTLSRSAFLRMLILREMKGS